MKYKKSLDSKQMYSDSPFGKFSYDRARSKKKFFNVLMNIKNKEYKKLYDIGCGQGYWFNIYEKLGFRKDNIVGLDQSRTSIKELKKKGYAVYEGDVLNLPFPNEVSDLTICNGVIHHTANSFKAFSELCRITKKRGGIIICVYNIWNPYFLFVYKLTFPLRYFYWNISKSIFTPTYIISYFLVQLLFLILFGRFQNKDTIKTLLMDQVFTPFAELFSQRKIKNYGSINNLTLLDEGLHTYCLMRYARFIKK